MTRSLHLHLLTLLVASLLVPAAPAQEAPLPATARAESAAQPFLWRVQRGATAGFLYGTIHLPDPRATAIPSDVQRAFESSDAFYAEIETTPAAELSVQSAALLPGGERLDRIVGPEVWARVKARLATAGLPPAFAEGMTRMKPWALGATLPMLRYLPEMSAGKPPLDKMLFQRAQRAGKTVGGLETPAEQIAAFEVFTRAEHVRMLEDSLDELDRYDTDGRDLMEETLTAWLSGDEARLLTLLDSGFGSDPALKERAAAALLWRRNRRLADRIDQRMTGEQVHFFAVGALHMPDAPTQRSTKPVDGAVAAEGERAGAQAIPTFEVAPGQPAPKLGLVTLLRARGFSVERVR